MRIGFVNFTSIAYDITTPSKKPLGGSESALCYLCIELAKKGHEVVLYGKYSKDFKIKRVVHKNENKLSNVESQKLDFLVNLNFIDGLEYLKHSAGGKTKIILWEHLAHNQPATFGLKIPASRAIFDWFVFVSNWQMENFVHHYGVNSNKSTVLRNAVAPVFENLFSNTSILKKKKPILVYTSTPFRGLEPLLRLFPEIKKHFPPVILKVFSSMEVYQDAGVPKHYFDQLYKLCQNTRGVVYCGSVPQKQLSAELKTALLLTYPNIWYETSSIAVMEALISGCKVITTGSAALPETTAGFAYLIPPNNHYQRNRDLFINQSVNTLERFTRQDAKLDLELIKQVEFCHNNYIWSNRVLEWERLFSTLK